MSNVDDAGQTMIRNLEVKTGKSLDEWVGIANASGLTKNREIIDFLKSRLRLDLRLRQHDRHDRAQPGRRCRLRTPTIWLQSQYAGDKAALRPIYDTLIEQIQRFGDDVELAPKKAYVSLRRAKQFAIIQPSTKTRVDVGINLKEAAPRAGWRHPAASTAWSATGCGWQPCKMWTTSCLAGCVRPTRLRSHNRQWNHPRLPATSISNSERISRTIEQLSKRVHERFPGSGLSQVCKDLYAISLTAERDLAAVSKPNWLAARGCHRVRGRAVGCFGILCQPAASRGRQHHLHRVDPGLRVGHQRDHPDRRGAAVSGVHRGPGKTQPRHPGHQPPAQHRARHRHPPAHQGPDGDHRGRLERRPAARSVRCRSSSWAAIWTTARRCFR